jgi:hypothetical protein
MSDDTGGVYIEVFSGPVLAITNGHGSGCELAGPHRHEWGSKLHSFKIDESSAKDLVANLQYSFREANKGRDDCPGPKIHPSRPIGAEVEGIAGRYPRAAVDEKALGYTLSYGFVDRVAHEAWHPEPGAGAYSMDKVEMILLKAEELLGSHPMSAEVEKAIDTVSPCPTCGKPAHAVMALVYGCGDGNCDESIHVYQRNEWEEHYREVAALKEKP